MKVIPWLKLFPATIAMILWFPTQTVQAQTEPVPLAPSSSPEIPEESAYEEYMRRGYAAAKRDDYQAAVQYFRSALFYNPNDQDATIAYWNAQDALNKRQSAAEEPLSGYDRYMEIGYDATEQENYQTALINFKRALEARPGDYYATQAIRNIETYIDGGAEIEEIISQGNIYAGELPYDRYMRLGYAAAQNEEYRQASRYFRSALYERPNDRQATIAFWNAQDVIRQGKDDSSSSESEYDRYMRIGYDATDRKNYQTALINFRRALEVRPGDQYATEAIRNLETYINQGTEASEN